MTMVEKQIKFSSWKIHFHSCVWKYWFSSININILEYWSWSWYWFWLLMNIDIGIDIGIQTNIDIDIDLDLDFLEGKLLISILILKKKIWKILILILNKNFILSHLWRVRSPNICQILVLVFVLAHEQAEKETSCFKFATWRTVFVSVWGFDMLDVTTICLGDLIT